MAQFSDLASPLFALVLGLSAQILLQRTPRSGRALMLVQQGIRGVVLIALGLWLSTWGTWVAVVLSFLGVVLIVGVPLLLLSTRWVAVIAVAVAVLSDPVNAWARQTLWSVVGGSPVLFDVAVLGLPGLTRTASRTCCRSSCSGRCSCVTASGAIAPSGSWRASRRSPTWCVRCSTS